MSALTDVYATWVTDVNDPPAPDQGAATDILQAVAPGLTDQQGDDWWVAVATLYESLGIINQPTYVQLRNEARGNAVGANALFEALEAGVFRLRESQVLVPLLEREVLNQEFLGISGNIITIETDRDLQTDQVLIDAYSFGIGRLRERELQLRQLLGII